MGSLGANGCLTLNLSINYRAVTFFASRSLHITFDDRLNF